MKSMAGAVVVLAGALLMGLATEHIPNDRLPTVTSVGLIAAGLFLVFRRNDGKADR